MATVDEKFTDGTTRNDDTPGSNSGCPSGAGVVARGGDSGFAGGLGGSVASLVMRPAADRIIGAEELAQHATSESCWCVRVRVPKPRRASPRLASALGCGAGWPRGRRPASLTSAAARPLPGLVAAHRAVSAQLTRAVAASPSLLPRVATVTRAETHLRTCLCQCA